MRLVPPPRSTSFYEMFSDLIFCTLVIFVVVVMALALQVREVSATITERLKKLDEQKTQLALQSEELETKKREAEKLVRELDESNREVEEAKAEAKSAVEELREKVDNVVWKNRFSGASDDTLMYIIHVPVNGRTVVVFMPSYIADRFDVVREEGGNDPRLELSDLALRTEGLTILTPHELLSMAGGLSHQLCLGIRMPGGDNAMALNRIIRAGEIWGAGFDRMSKMQLRNVIGGLGGEVPDNLHSSLHGVDQAYIDWRWAPDRSTWWGRAAETVAPLREATEDTASEPPYLRFTSTEDREIRVGTHTMAVPKFRDVLRSIAPGEGFYIEYVSPDGEAVEPPDWVLNEVLKELGFGGRIVREDALVE